MEPKLPADCEYHLTQLFQTPELRTEIRAYLRHRLFTSIQNSSLGPSLSRKDVQPVSPKLQTLNLLVAEYLLRHRHHFTLSVFSCEVPSVSCLSPSLQDTLRGRSTSSSVPFCEEDLNDMMETLGILPTCSHGQELLVRYAKKEQPLLECLIRALPQLRSPDVAPVQLRDQSSNTERKQNTSESSIAEATVRQSYLNAITELKMLHEKELNDERDKCASRLLEKEQESQQLNYKHTVEEQKLRELITSLQDQLRQAQVAVSEIRAEKITDTQKVESEKRKNDSTQEAMEQKLQLRQIKLSEESHRLEREKLGLKKIKKKLQLKQRQLDEVAVALTHSQQDQPDQSVIPALEIQLQIKEQEVSEQKAEAQKLREENEMLKSMCEQQRSRIENMNVRMAELVSELHHTRENLAETSAPKWPSYHSSHHSRRHFSSSSSDGSPTDEIVHDAKRRIKILEEEFEAISLQHKGYQERILTESILAAMTGTSSALYFAAKHNTSGPGWTPDQPINLRQSTLSNVQLQTPRIPNLPKNTGSRQRTVTVPQETPKHRIEKFDNSSYNQPVDEFRTQSFNGNLSAVENIPQSSQQNISTHSNSNESKNTLHNASSKAIETMSCVPTQREKQYLNAIVAAMDVLVPPREELSSVDHVPSFERNSLHIGPMGDNAITRHETATTNQPSANPTFRINEITTVSHIGPMGDYVISKDQPASNVQPSAVHSNETSASHIGPMGDMTARGDPNMNFNHVASVNGAPSIEQTTSLIGPMGDNTRDEPPTSMKSIQPTLNILQTENINIYTSERLDSSISVNGHSHSEASFAAQEENSHHSLAEQHLIQHQSEVSQPLQLKSDYKLKDPQISSSSSSKHISVGITSPKPEEDDFWDM